MKKDLFSFRSLAVGMLVAGIGLAAAPAMASATTATVDTSACVAGQFYQPFLSWNDSNDYELMPGEAAGDFSGAGWTLSGGAKIVTTRLANGTYGEVLDLPSGSKAVSPTICVAANYPIARTIVRDVKGSEGVFVDVSYAGTSTWATPKNTGQVHSTAGTAWALSGSMNLQPSNMFGWQILRLTLVPGGTSSDFQVYNLYVDPKMAH